jgi:hypothetical protein
MMMSSVSNEDNPAIPRWIDLIEPVDAPWRDWLAGLPAVVERGYSPLSSWIEAQVDDAIRAADTRRLAIDATTRTKHFDVLWKRFRHHHEALDGCYDYRRLRYCVWRAAALTVICARGHFQDEIDAVQARDMLDATMREVVPDIEASYSLWEVRADSALEDYASMVMLIIKAVLA